MYKGSHPVSSVPSNFNWYMPLLSAYPKIPKTNFARYPRTVSAHVVSACIHTGSVSQRNDTHCLLFIPRSREARSKYLPVPLVDTSPREALRLLLTETIPSNSSKNNK